MALYSAKLHWQYSSETRGSSRASGLMVYSEYPVSFVFSYKSQNWWNASSAPVEWGEIDRNRIVPARAEGSLTLSKPYRKRLGFPAGLFRFKRLAILAGWRRCALKVCL